MIAAVLEHAREELLGGLLGRGHVLGLLVHRQEQPRLQLEQRGDQHQELGRRLEVELARLLEVLDVGDDHLAKLDFGEVHALAQDDRHEEIEWARKDVELEVQIGYRHEGQSSHGTGRGHGVRPQPSIVRRVAERGDAGTVSRPARTRSTSTSASAMTPPRSSRGRREASSSRRSSPDSPSASRRWLSR